MLQVYLDWIASHVEQILTVLSSGIVVGVFGFIVRVLTNIWREIHGRGRAVLIRSSRDNLIPWIEDLQEAVFPPDECDPRGVLGRRIDRSRFDLFGRPRSDEAMIAIVYLKGRTPVAYLSAEYFRETGGIFFWYIVSLHDKKYKERLPDLNWAEIESVRESIAPKLIDRLLDTCSAGGGWRYVVAEVDINDIAEARKKIGSFQRAASDVIRQRLRRLSARFRRVKPHPNDPRVFKLEMPFSMPLHDADMLHEAQAHESPGWMVFSPRFPDDYRTYDGHAIDAETVRNDLLKTLLLLGYRSDNEAYNAYIENFHRRLGAQVPPTVRMIHNRSVMNTAPAGPAEPLDRQGGNKAPAAAPRRRKPTRQVP